MLRATGERRYNRRSQSASVGLLVSPALSLVLTFQRKSSMSIEKPVLPEVRRFESSTGVRIYRITCDAFPGLTTNIYLLLEAGPLTLVDTGTGFGDANQQLLEGIEKVKSEFGEPVSVGDIRRIIITHGHIDHF